MARFFEQEDQHAIVGRHILELASGTGVLGLHLGVMGAQQVVMTDKNSMIQLIQCNIAENKALFAASNTRATMHAASLDWFDSTADPIVLAAVPFDTIVMSDVIYEEEIVEPLVHTLRRLCHLHLQHQQHTISRSAHTDSHSQMNTLCPPPVYLCASHRTERMEDMFFEAVAPWFTVIELSAAVSPVLTKWLNRDAIAIWLLEARAEKFVDLVDGIGALHPRIDGKESEEEVMEEVVVRKIRDTPRSIDGASSLGHRRSQTSTSAPHPRWKRESATSGDGKSEMTGNQLEVEEVAKRREPGEEDKARCKPRSCGMRARSGVAVSISESDCGVTVPVMMDGCGRRGGGSTGRGEVVRPLDRRGGGSTGEGEVARPLTCTHIEQQHQTEKCRGDIDLEDLD